MTYNEFMKQFNDYVFFKIETELRKFKTAKEAAKYFGISEATISRLKSGIGKPDRASLMRICGDDLYDQDVKSLDDLKLEYYKAEIKRIEAERARKTGKYT